MNESPAHYIGGKMINEWYRRGFNSPLEFQLTRERDHYRNGLRAVILNCNDALADENVEQFRAGLMRIWCAATHTYNTKPSNKSCPECNAHLDVQKDEKGTFFFETCGCEEAFDYANEISDILKRCEGEG